MKPYIVEFIGLAGVGKSTYTKALYNHLKKLGIETELIQGNSIYGDKFRLYQPIKFIWCFLKRPYFGVTLLFYFIKNFSFNGIRSCFQFSLWFFRVIIYADFINSKKKQEFSVLCIDKGIFTRMVKLTSKIDLLSVFNVLLKHDLLTNTLVELKANHNLILDRRKNRDKGSFVQIEKKEIQKLNNILFIASKIKELDYIHLDNRSDQGIDQNILLVTAHINKLTNLGVSH